MLVKDVMTTEVQSVRADAPLLAAVDLLEHREEGVLAVYEGTEFLGPLTEHDIADWIAAPGRDVTAAKARDLVHPVAAFPREDQDVQEVARVMTDRRVSSIVVVRDGKPVGTVSLANLATRFGGVTAPEAERAGGGEPPAQHAPLIDAGARVEPTLLRPVPAEAPPARITLQPIAAPSILGLFGLAAAALLVGAFYAHWFGDSRTPLYIAPLAALLGGLAQLLAGMWAFRARDGLATTIHGAWGAFWLAYGVLYALVAAGSLGLAPVDANFGWWFIPLGAISAAGAIAALGRNFAQSALLTALTAACVLAAIGLLGPSSGPLKAGGYLLLVSALLAWYLATALLLEDSFRRVVLPLGKREREANIPGQRTRRAVEWRQGEPGVRAGQ